jgi:hypothetical protein
MPTRIERRASALPRAIVTSPLSVPWLSLQTAPLAGQRPYKAFRHATVAVAGGVAVAEDAPEPGPGRHGYPLHAGCG